MTRHKTFRLFFLSILFLFQNSCNILFGPKECKFLGSYIINLYEVDGIDSLGYLNTTIFQCNDYRINLTWVSGEDPHGSFGCKTTGFIDKFCYWGAGNRSFYITDDNAAWCDTNFVFASVFGQGRWEITKIKSTGFALSQERNGKQYKAHWKKIEDWSNRCPY